MELQQAIHEMRLEATLEDLAEIPTLPELIATYAQWVEDKTGCDEDPRCLEAFNKAWERIESTKPTEKEVTDALERQLASLQAMLQPTTPVRPVEKVVRTFSRKYKVLDMEIRWTTKPQVLTIMDILKAHGVKVNDEIDEDAIVKMMVANEAALATKQGGKRIWDYYKGDHHQGLSMHGNIQKLK